MATTNCSACETLRTDAPNLIVNGITDTECSYLQNNTGLSGNSDDCTDLDLMNDCFIGNMEDEVDAYEVCDWKTFMKNFIPNIWTVFKGIICSICGLWTKVDSLECQVNQLFEGGNLYVGEDSSDGSYVVPGGGVSYKFDSSTSGGRVSDVSALYIAGGLLRVQGTFRFFKDDFTDADGTSRPGNSHWGETGACVAGGERICEIYIKKSQYGVSHIYAGVGQETGGGGYHLNATVFSDKDSDGNPVFAYGQHGSCNTETGVGYEGHSDGHRVPDGYIIIQLRMSYIWSLNANGASDPENASHYSPRAWMGIRFDKNAIEC